MSLAGRNILIVDDQPDVREALRLLLKGVGCKTETADSPRSALSSVETKDFDLVLMDLNYTRDTTSGDEGLAALHRLRKLPSAPPVVVMTAWGSMQLAVEAVRIGAVDFVTKPWENTGLLAMLERRVSESRPDRREDDLALARRVQARLMPQSIPTLAGLEVAVFCQPARAVGGDCYDFLRLASGRTGIVAADVSGKGVAAALLTANLHGALHAMRASFDTDFHATLDKLHGDLHASTLPEQYVTLFAAIWDADASKVEYLSAGYPQPLLIRNKEAQRLDANAAPLGLFAHWQAEPSSLTLQSGDLMLIFSDGVDHYGEDAVVNLASSLAHLEPQAIVDRIAEEVLRDGLAPDDLTLIAFRRS